MIKNYIKVALRNLTRNQAYSLINIGGLAIGITVAMLIGLWIHDELSFNKYHKNHDDIAQVWGGGTDPETLTIEGSYYLQYPLGAVLKNNYQHYFRHALMAWGAGDRTLSFEDKKIKKKGQFIEGDALEMLSLKMLKGSYGSLSNPNSIVLSKTTAESIFGGADPINKSLRIDNRMDVQVTGIYEDIPKNNRFSEVQFFSPFVLWATANDWIKRNENDWDNRPVNVFVQLQPGTSMEAANAAIKDLYYENIPQDFLNVIEASKPFVQVIPMSTWHLYSEFENGKPTGGRITFVWGFGIVGIFVLLLACINFINLSTARSEKRAREVGVRKTIGSSQGQLIFQFLGESFMVVMMAFFMSLVLLSLLQGWFNELADKDIAMPFSNLGFWVIAFLFLVLTGFMAGLYPAAYLSSFQPVKVLKGTLNVGQFASFPRQVLVVVQFTVSVILIIGTLVVYQQIEFARNRPIGYDRNGLITVPMADPEYIGKHDVLKTELLNTGVISELSLSSGPLTSITNMTGGYEWPGKDPNIDAVFVICNVTPDFGKTIGWEFVAGRDFSSDISTDLADAIIINETAANYMSLANPVGKELIDVDEFGNPQWSRKIIGVVKDIVMESPYEPVMQTLYYFNKNASSKLHIKINPAVSASVALPKIEAVFKRVLPSTLFDYQFVDEQYARKFGQEERIGKLSGLFSGLAIFISCLGLFGLASFVAEQRTKEIGIRKVMGASVSNLLRMLSRDFVLLVIISCVIAIPIALYFMSRWLQRFDYRTEISMWILLVTCIGALVITLLTVSYQALRAAMMNPVKSLRSE
ncbi:MAG: ABC transporter permease [Cyclobacteriaceae bacterium]